MDPIRFADRDMLMRYYWGLGVGHTYSHGDRIPVDYSAIASTSASEEEVNQDNPLRQDNATGPDTPIVDFVIQEGDDEEVEDEEEEADGDEFDLDGSDGGGEDDDDDDEEKDEEDAQLLLVYGEDVIR